MSDALIAAPCVIYVLIKPGGLPAAAGELPHSTYTYFPLQAAVVASILGNELFSMYKAEPYQLSQGAMYVLSAPESGTVPSPEPSCRMDPAAKRPEVVNGTKCILFDMSGVVPAAAAPAPVAGGEGPITEARMRALLREEAAPEVISISKATDKHIFALLEAAGIVGTQGQSAPAVPPTFTPPVEPFSWVGGEEARSPAATLQLAHYLASAGVPITAAGGRGPGFKLVDVRREDILTTQLGRVVLKGRPDAVVIPSEQFAGMPAQQARVVIDYKQDACAFADIVLRAQGELLAASSLSHHDVLVVFTDLNTFGHVLRAEEDKVLVWSDLTVVQMLYVVASFLKDECAPVIIGKRGDVRVPGDETRKRRRFSLVERAHALVPKPTELLDQLEVFNTGHWEDYLEGRELLFNAMTSSSNTE